MKAKSFFLILTTAFTLASCGGKMSPYAYNQKIIGLHDSSWDYLSQRMELIFDYKNTSKEQAKLIIDSLNLKYDGILKELGEMQYPDEAAEFHKVATSLFTLVKDSVIPLYSETLNLEPESEKWYDVWNKIDHFVQVRGSEIEAQIGIEQKKFADAVGERLHN